MLVKIKKTHAREVGESLYLKGDVVDIDNVSATWKIEHGFAVQYTEAKQEKPKTETKEEKTVTKTKRGRPKK